MNQTIGFWGAIARVFLAGSPEGRALDVIEARLCPAENSAPDHIRGEATPCRTETREALSPCFPTPTMAGDA